MRIEGVKLELHDCILLIAGAPLGEELKGILIHVQVKVGTRSALLNFGSPVDASQLYKLLHALHPHPH
ncbi:hypothetical protein C5167_001472 [Papaver somniferum]|uniref:Uncharacterized protein n=1 Tax=Papaver somniferum TaxID=3469 RepID=A0A4Y7KVF3_PAPSO|nr:hypothetical protein C5167_001472 [Papaver somniferum]